MKNKFVKNQSWVWGQVTYWEGTVKYRNTPLSP